MRDTKKKAPLRFTIVAGSAWRLGHRHLRVTIKLHCKVGRAVPPLVPSMVRFLVGYRWW